jgi:hypothetical protein
VKFPAVDTRPWDVVRPRAAAKYPGADDSPRVAVADVYSRDHPSWTPMVVCHFGACAAAVVDSSEAMECLADDVAEVVVGPHYLDHCRSFDFSVVVVVAVAAVAFSFVVRENAAVEKETAR